jgi:uncharacterized protein (TIGR03435 family)
MSIRNRSLILSAAGLLAAGLICAQSKDHPQFDVASVKVNKERKQPLLAYNPLGIDLSGVPLTWVIGEAYNIPYSRVSTQDSRVAELLVSRTDSYDIAAKADHPVSKDQVRLMLRALLADRFKLGAHPEAKTESVYKLGLAKSGSKLKASEGGGEPSSALGLGGFECRNMVMARFAGILSQYLDRPVIDATGLTGLYDFTLKFEVSGPPDQVKRGLVDWFMSSIFADIQSQLGLQLSGDKASVEYLVVDHAEKPSEN